MEDAPRTDISADDGRDGAPTSFGGPRFAAPTTGAVGDDDATKPGDVPAAIGPYMVEGILGRGGMGVVYRARDPRLARTVAIKALPQEFAADEERLSRFLREARTLASLNHPNIASIYGLEEVGNAKFLILEMVEGRSLSMRLREGAMTLGEAAKVCRQIAEALEAAHERGVVHRDLKPDNVKVTPSGVVKVLDFGIAKVGHEKASTGGARPDSAAIPPTQVYTARTQTGAIIGTPGYMSPEQARGEPVDKRTDVWAFGCVLFECLTGRQVFRGKSVSDVLLATIQQEPDFGSLPRDTPEPLLSLLRRCLEKDPQERLRDIGDARIELQQVITPSRITREIPKIEGPKGNLPRQLTSFIGRDAELEEVANLLGGSGLLTLTGSGGCGKTRLALAAAEEVQWQFGDGAWLVELAPVADESLVAQTCATALGVREEPGKTLMQTLTGFLADKTLLIVLDNCEHVIGACTQLADSLLKGCPRLKILASSRESLGIGGEKTFRVPSLRTPDPRNVPRAEELVKFESVRLLMERAAAAGGKPFEVNDANAAAVAKICHRLDGIPLALELVAARLKAMSADQVEKRLNEAFRLLTGGSRTALPRQQTLRALIDWSYGLLSEQEKTLLRRLSVFAGGWRLEAAETVTSGDGIDEFEVIDLLTHLVEKNLVVFEEERAGTGSRYRMLETVRQYSRDRLLESGEGAASRTKHAGYFLALADEANPKLRGPDQSVWLTRLETEHDNMRAALEWLTAEGGDSEAGLRLGAALWRFWWTRGHFSEGRTHLEAALAAAAQGGAAATEARAMTMHGAGWLAKVQGDGEAAQRHLSAALEVRKAAGNKTAAAGTLSLLGLLAQNRGDLDGAAATYAEALAMQREAGNTRGAAGALLNVGSLAYVRGQFDEAKTAWEESLGMYRKMGDALYVAGLLNNLGNVAMRQGNFTKARSNYSESLKKFRELGSVSDVALSLEGFAWLECATGQPRVAAQLFAAAETIRAAICAPVPEEDKVSYAENVATTRKALEGEPGAFDQEWAAGKAMSESQAVSLALAGDKG